MSFDVLIVLIIALPLAGFLISAAIGRRLGARDWWIPVGAVVASWVAGALCLVRLWRSRSVASAV